MKKFSLKRIIAIILLALNVFAVVGKYILSAPEIAVTAIMATLYATIMVFVYKYAAGRLEGIIARVLMFAAIWATPILSFFYELPSLWVIFNLGYIAGHVGWNFCVIIATVLLALDMRKKSPRKTSNFYKHKFKRYNNLEEKNYVRSDQEIHIKLDKLERRLNSDKFVGKEQLPAYYVSLEQDAKDIEAEIYREAILDLPYKPTTADKLKRVRELMELIKEHSNRKIFKKSNKPINQQKTAYNPPVVETKTSQNSSDLEDEEIAEMLKITPEQLQALMEASKPYRQSRLENNGCASNLGAVAGIGCAALLFIGCILFLGIILRGFWEIFF